MNPLVTIRELRVEDIPYAAAIVSRNYSADDAVAATKELQAMFVDAAIGPTYVVANVEGSIVGFAGYIQSWMDYHGYNIFWVNVDPEHQRKGIGKRLVARVLEDIREVDKRNKAYFALLTTTSPTYYAQHFGFKVVETFGPKNHSLMYLSLE